jgi:hypothetical protein
MLIPVLGVGWVMFCLFDLIRAKQVRYLPKWGWAILCCGIGLTIPFGGILYLWVGSVRHPRGSVLVIQATGSEPPGPSGWRGHRP